MENSRANFLTKIPICWLVVQILTKHSRGITFICPPCIVYILLLTRVVVQVQFVLKLHKPQCPVRSTSYLFAVM